MTHEEDQLIKQLATRFATEWFDRAKGQRSKVTFTLLLQRQLEFAYNEGKRRENERVQAKLASLVA